MPHTVCTKEDVYVNSLMWLSRNVPGSKEVPFLPAGSSRVPNCKSGPFLLLSNVTSIFVALPWLKRIS